jgi:predicted dehydrogenase
MGRSHFAARAVNNGKIGVGVLGLGQGRSHLRAFQLLDGSTVAAVCDQDTVLAGRVAQEHGIEKRHPAYEAMLEDPAIDLVVVATPDHLHGQHAIMALEAGKHVLSEIPMAITLDECRRIIELTDRHGLKYHMGNQVRYAFCLRDVQQMIRTGDLGEIFYGEGEYLHTMDEIVANRRSDHWRVHPHTPQTTLLGGGPHAVDTLRWLMNVDFVEAQAYHAEQQSRWQTTHTTVAIFKAAGGAVAKVTVSYGMVRPYCLYYSVYGSAGSFERTRDQGGAVEDTINYHYHDRIAGARRMAPVTLPNWSNPAIQRQHALGHGTMEIEQAQHFLRAIVTDEEPAIGPREAARSVAAGICALQSADQGGGPVAIPTFD